MRWPRRSRAVPSRYVSCFFNLPRADFHVRLHAFSNAEAQPQRDQGLLLRSELGPRLSELVNYISNGFVFVSKSLCVVLKLLLLWSAALPFIYAHAHFQSRVLPRRRARAADEWWLPPLALRAQGPSRRSSTSHGARTSAQAALCVATRREAAPASRLVLPAGHPRLRGALCEAVGRCTPLRRQGQTLRCWATLPGTPAGAARTISVRGSGAASERWHAHAIALFPPGAVGRLATLVPAHGPRHGSQPNS